MADPKEPRVTVPLSTVIDLAVQKALEKHMTPLVVRVEKVELSVARLLGFMAGSGLIGGLIGGVLGK
jgi:hypothetical protein